MFKFHYRCIAHNSYTISVTKRVSEASAGLSKSDSESEDDSTDIGRYNK